jgi:aminodeoxyfutalosine synthase
MMNASPPSMTTIEEKVRAGVRLDAEDGVFLFEKADFLRLARLAREAKVRKSGTFAYFNVNRHINLTNICVSRCRFCAFCREEGDPEAYLMSVEDALRSAEEALPLGITELHIVSGLHPTQPFEYYEDVIRQCRERFPSLHLQAFTAVEIGYFAEISGHPVEVVLRRLKDAGLGSLPGGGAEIFNPALRRKICRRKATAREWLQVMRTAHTIGLRSNATMLYGHLESPLDRVEHLLRLRELQDETGGFQSFIPLPFHPANTELSHLARTSAHDDLRTMAVSRLLLDNFMHVKAFWIMLGLKIAQISLFFGSDDLDGTVVEERITHAAGATTGQYLSRADLLDIIREAGCTPVERDTLYSHITEYAGTARTQPTS